MAENGIKNLNDILNIAIKASEKFGDIYPWWRGQAQQNWKLVPAVYRYLSYRYEQGVFINFTQRARSRSQNYPEKNDTSGWAFLAQHYGLPTRLLDWTESILVATYFAVAEKEHDDQPGVLWALHPSLLNLHQTRQEMIYGARSPEVIQIWNAIHAPGIKNSEYILAVTPSETDIRMMVQLAVCTIHGKNTPIEDIADENLPENEKFLMKFEITVEAKRTLLGNLSEFGIRESTIFPDLEHLASELRSDQFQAPANNP